MEDILLKGRANGQQLNYLQGHENVIPADAGIQTDGPVLDSHSPLKSCGDRFRGNDGDIGAFSDEPS